MNTPAPEPHGSVFTPVNQDAMISRIEALESDELEVSYLETPDPDAAGRVMGVAHSTAGTTAQYSSPPSPVAPEPTPMPPAAALGFDDPGVRAAFILHGPAGLTA